MPNFDPTQVDAHIQDVDVATLSDADASTVLSLPTLTPRRDRITFVTLASDAFWGADRAAMFKAWLRGAYAQGGAIGALADLVLGILDGAGLDPADPQAQVKAQNLVDAGACTSDERDATMFYPATYRCGGPVPVEAVVASRARIALSRQADATKAWFDDQIAGVYGQIAAWRSSGSFPDDAKAQLQALIDPTK